MMATKGRPKLRKQPSSLKTSKSESGEVRKLSALGEMCKDIGRHNGVGDEAKDVVLAGMNARLQVREEDSPAAAAPPALTPPSCRALSRGPAARVALQNLQSPLDGYNGQQVKPQRCKHDPDHLVVTLQGGGMHNVNLVVTKLQLKIGKAPAQQFRSKVAKEETVRAEKNVKLAMAAVSARIRTAVRQSTKSIEQVGRSVAAPLHRLKQIVCTTQHHNRTSTQSQLTATRNTRAAVTRRRCSTPWTSPATDIWSGRS
jgi:hypothetical protein